MSIEEKVRVLEEIENIKKLKYSYCYLCDGYKTDELLNLFCKDAELDFHEFGKYAGISEISSFFKETIPKAMTFFVHMVSNPFIEVIDNEHAKGTWYANVPATLNGEARWMCGRYEEEYIKEEGVWKFKVMNFFWFYETPFDAGWVKERMKL